MAGMTLRRSSHEERGLKFDGLLIALCADCRSSHEERGLKCADEIRKKLKASRSSHEERGLKFLLRRVGAF